MKIKSIPAISLAPLITAPAVETAAVIAPAGGNIQDAKTSPPAAAPHKLFLEVEVPS